MQRNRRIEDLMKPSSAKTILGTKTMKDQQRFEELEGEIMLAAFRGYSVPHLIKEFEELWNKLNETSVSKSEG